jgi:DNA polymerase
MTMARRDDIIAHLRLYGEMGVAGISRDPAWRERQAPAGAIGAIDAASASAASGAPDATPATPVSPAPRVIPAPDAPIDDDAARLAALPTTPADEALAALRAHIGPCTRCPLGTLGRKQVVFGTGSPTAQLMFVGEGPGADEDQQGEPFVGQAGQLLTKIIAAIDFTRADVYIANVVKCRPPGNRNPEPVEVATCSPFLVRQIDIIRPRVIVALGAFAAQTLLQTKTPISKLRGVVHDWRPGTRVIPTFHPSFLLRNRNNRDLYRDVWEDVKKARALISDPG